MNQTPMNANEMRNNPYINQSQNTAPLEQNPYVQPSNVTPQVDNSLLGSFDSKQFLIGALIGAAGAYLLTNENAQKTLFKTVAKGTQMFHAGMEEMKERFEDARAELDAENS